MWPHRQAASPEGSPRPLHGASWLRNRLPPPPAPGRQMRAAPRWEEPVPTGQWLLLCFWDWKDRGGPRHLRGTPGWHTHGALSRGRPEGVSVSSQEVRGGAWRMLREAPRFGPKSTPSHVGPSNT